MITIIITKTFVNIPFTIIINLEFLDNFKKVMGIIEVWTLYNSILLRD